MSLTFLQLVAQSANELGIPEPSQVIGATDDTSKQLLALAIREGKEFSQMANKNGGWQILHKEYSFNTNGYTSTGTTVSGSAVVTSIPSTTGYLAGMVVTGTGIPTNTTISSVDSSTQVTLSASATASNTVTSLTFGMDNYALPSDLEYFATKTFWDGAFRWQLVGPLEAQEKNIIKYGLSPVGPRRRFWIRNNRFYINPAASNLTDTVKFDYYSNAWCTDSLGNAQTKWTADTDLYLLDEDCFVLGMKWRFLRAKGLDYAQELDTYMRAAQRVMARDGAGRDLPMNAQAQELYLLSSANIPDTNYGQ